MNTKRIVFWSVFVVILGLIVWGLAVAMKKSAISSATNGLPTGTPAPVNIADHVKGQADTPITLIEYGDFQCPACEAYYPMVTQVLASSTVPIRYVYRHFPLPQHPNAMPAAMAAEAAGAQGKFWPMYDLLFTDHVDWTELSDPTQAFVDYAGQLGLNVPEFQADLSSSTLMSVITEDQADGNAIGLSYTPTFFVNGKAIANPQSYEAFTAVIEAAVK